MYSCRCVLHTKTRGIEEDFPGSSRKLTVLMHIYIYIARQFLSNEVVGTWDIVVQHD